MVRIATSARAGDEQVARAEQSPGVASTPIESVYIGVSRLVRRRVKESFAAYEYGPEYLNIGNGELVDADMNSVDEGRIKVVNRRSDVGWVPAAYVVECFDATPFQQLLDFFRHLLRCLVVVGKLLSLEELIASHSSFSAFGKIENAGDNYMSHVGHTFARSAFETLDMTVQEQDFWTCASGLHSNVGMGPFCCRGSWFTGLFYCRSVE